MRMESDKITANDSQVATLATGQVVYDALVLDARLRQSLVTVRSLGGRGLRVMVLDTCDGLPLPAFSSRWCQYRFLCPTREPAQPYLTYLERVLYETGMRVLLTSPCSIIALIRQHGRWL